MRSKNRINCASMKRSESVARRGFCFRSTYIASCLRRKRFSAARPDEDRSHRYTNVTASIRTAKIEKARTRAPEHERENLINRANEYGGAGFSADGVFAEHTRRRPHKLHADKGYDYRHLRLALRRAGSSPASPAVVSSPRTAWDATAVVTPYSTSLKKVVEVIYQDSPGAARTGHCFGSANRP